LLPSQSITANNMPRQPRLDARLARPPRSAWQEGGPERAQTRYGGLGKGDERILGSGEFVEEILAESNESHSGKRFEYDRHGSRQVRGEGKKDTPVLLNAKPI